MSVQRNKPDMFTRFLRIARLKQSREASVRLQSVYQLQPEANSENRSNRRPQGNKNNSKEHCCCFAFAKRLIPERNLL